MAQEGSRQVQHDVPTSPGQKRRYRVRWSAGKLGGSAGDEAQASPEARRAGLTWIMALHSLAMDGEQRLLAGGEREPQRHRC